MPFQTFTGTSSLPSSGNIQILNNLGHRTSPGAATITEYAPYATSPTFTIYSGMYEPFNVTTDSHGNVYEADADGAVSEYAPLNGNPWGAVDGLNFVP